MTTVLLSAGNASRLGDHAPRGCKAMAKVGQQTMLEHWSGWDDELVLVCRSAHIAALPADIDDYLDDVVVCDEGGGAAVAVKAALGFADSPLTVAYADTWVAQVPDGDDWCGVAAAKGGRRWDLVEDGFVSCDHLPPSSVGLACVGLYRFSDHDRLAKALDVAIEMGDGEVGMANVVNMYGLPFTPVVGWQDVGDAAALEAWRPL